MSLEQYHFVYQEIISWPGKMAILADEIGKK